MILTAIAAAAAFSSCGNVGNETKGTASGASQTQIEESGQENSSDPAGTTAASKENGSSSGTDKSSPGLLEKIFGGKTNENGKQYRNYNEDVIDGFCYRTEEDISSTLIAYDRNGETWLFDPRNIFSAIDPDGLCEPEPGKVYDITYDVQYTTGGVAGVHEAEMLKVSAFTPAEASAIFVYPLEYRGIRSVRNTSPAKFLSCVASGQKGASFICVRTGNGYTVYAEDGAELHFDELRQVNIPFESTELKGVSIGYSVLCNKGVTDERIINAIKKGTVTEDKDIFLIGTCSEGTDVIYASEAAGVNEDTLPLADTEFPSVEGFRKVITNEELERGVTAEELGLDPVVFSIARSEWEDEKHSYIGAHNGDERFPYCRGVLILGGSFTDSDILFMDDNARFCVANRSANPGSRDKPMDYAIFTVCQEYLDMFPQE